jgi:uncharacterized protein (DUF1330 family)
VASGCGCRRIAFALGSPRISQRRHHTYDRIGSLAQRQAQWEEALKTKYAVTLSLLAGMAIGSVAMQGLHAQGAKLKAWSVGEIEPVSGATVSASYLKDARDAIANAHGRALRTVNGRVIAIDGNAPAKVAIVEWDSADDAVAFYKSEAWKKLTPEREKTQKTLRRYVVEAEP